ncbi:MAG: hypothetical protein EHM28_12235, partial [Spirochaetaceae bacterium]
MHCMRQVHPDHRSGKGTDRSVLYRQRFPGHCRSSNGPATLGSAFKDSNPVRRGLPHRRSLIKKKTQKGGAEMTGANKFLFIILFCLAALPIFATGQYEIHGDPSWDTFRGDFGLTGKVTGTFPKKLVLQNRFPLNDEITATPVIANGMMFIGTLSGKMICMDIKTGNVIWAYETGDSIEAPALMVPRENIVVFGTLEGIVHAVDITTGKLRWKYATDGQIMGGANYFISSLPNRIVIVVGSYDNML